MFSLSSLRSVPDEEFDMLGDDELALLTTRFERMHENQVNMRRNTRTCFQCSKPRHFVADCPEKVENKDNYKDKLKTDGKYQSRRDHKHKHKSKHKDERPSKNKDGRCKARAMVGASDIDCSSAYSTSSLSRSEDEGDQRKGRKPSRNLSGLSCFARIASEPWRLAPAARRATKVTQTPTPMVRYVMNFPSCVRKMNGLACCLITLMICLERLKNEEGA
jgi:hypothetical protein